MAIEQGQARYRYVIHIKSSNNDEVYVCEHDTLETALDTHMPLDGSFVPDRQYGITQHHNHFVTTEAEDCRPIIVNSWIRLTRRNRHVIPISVRCSIQAHAQSDIVHTKVPLMTDSEAEELESEDDFDDYYEEDEEDMRADDFDIEIPMEV